MHFLLPLAKAMAKSCSGLVPAAQCCLTVPPPFDPCQAAAPVHCCSVHKHVVCQSLAEPCQLFLGGWGVTSGLHRRTVLSTPDHTNLQQPCAASAEPAVLKTRIISLPFSACWHSCKPAVSTVSTVFCSETSVTASRAVPLAAFKP
jgi:hypothetical protein